MKKTSFKDYLVDIIPKDKIEKINRSFEIVGNIVIIEISEDLVKYQKEIGNAFLQMNPRIKTVLKKSGVHGGEFRTQSMEYVAGVNTKETVYLENGIKLNLNVEEVYFSTKLGTERDKLSSNIKENSNVLVMFSGCGPYTFNILKKQPDINIIDSIEINPVGHKFALENLEINKNLIKKSKKFKDTIEKLKEEGKYINEKEIVKKINSQTLHFYNGDVRKEIKKLNNKYDYIFMPLPKDAELFLDCAFEVANNNCLVHMYDFVHDNEFPSKSENAIKEAAKKFGREVEIISTRKVGQYSPRKFRVCCDFIIK